MLLDVLVHCMINLDEFWVKNSKICTTDPRNHAISENYANSEILQQGLRPSCANSVALWTWPTCFGLLAQFRVRGAF